MTRLAIIFVAVFVTVVAAAPNSFLGKSIAQVKRAATLLQSLQPMTKRDLVIGGVVDLGVFDLDKDDMLDAKELIGFVKEVGVPKGEEEEYVALLLKEWDLDKNGKLDKIELQELDSDDW